MAGALITEIIVKNFATGESVESEGFFCSSLFLPSFFPPPTSNHSLSPSLSLFLFFFLWRKIISYSLSTKRALGIR